MFRAVNLFTVVAKTLPNYFCLPIFLPMNQMLSAVGALGRVATNEGSVAALHECQSALTSAKVALGHRLFVQDVAWIASPGGQCGLSTMRENTCPSNGVEWMIVVNHKTHYYLVLRWLYAEEALASENASSSAANSCCSSAHGPIDLQCTSVHLYVETNSGAVLSWAIATPDEVSMLKNASMNRVMTRTTTTTAATADGTGGSGASIEVVDRGRYPAPLVGPQVGAAVPPRHDDERLGSVSFDKFSLVGAILRTRAEFGEDYSRTLRNCKHFTEELVSQLRAGPRPNLDVSTVYRSWFTGTYGVPSPDTETNVDGDETKEMDMYPYRTNPDYNNHQALATLVRSVFPDKFALFQIRLEKKNPWKRIQPAAH